jgi:peptidoglycan hydrolase-like protein with peptidoglycan-binding domain
MLAIFKNKKIIISFFSWLIFIFLFDLIIFLKKDSESLTSIETIFLLLTIGGGVISFIIFILSLEKLYHEKYPKIKASIFSSLSFIIFVIFGVGLIITPFIVFNKNKEIVKPTEASKNTLISSPLKLGSSGEDVKLLQAVLSTDKSIYPSGLVSGYYGDLTKQAIINFQQKYNLPQTGALDQQTIDKFNEVYGDKSRDYYFSKIPIQPVLHSEPISVKESSNNNINTNVNNTQITPIIKKVPIYLDDSGGITKGTFYCFEDKVNYLSNQQNLIRIKQMGAESCNSQAQFEGQQCVDNNCKPLTDINEYSSCLDKCYKDAYSKCNSDLGALREQFFREIQQFCP